jgi:uncharacterized RDD family membrane protein YckC
MRFPNLSFSKKPEDDSEVRYANLSSRAFALTLDMLLLFIFLGPVFNYAGNWLYPEFHLQGGEAQVQNTLAALSAGQISAEQTVHQLREVGLFRKLALDYILQFIVSGVLIVLAWIKYDTTPGLFLFRMRLADASTGGKPSTVQYIIRYVVGVIAIAPMMLGMLLMFFNQRKMALHDVAAQTVVLQRKFRFKRKAHPSEEAEASGE